MTIPTNTDRGLARLYDWLIRRKVPLLVLAVVLTLLAGPVAQRLRFDESIESFFAPDDPLLRAWLDSHSWFGKDEFILVAFRDEQLFEAEADESPEDRDDAEDSSAPPLRVSTDHLNRIAEFARDLGAVPGIVPESTQSLETFLRPKLGDTPASRILARIYARRKQEEILKFGEHLAISSDRNTTAILLRLLPAKEAPVITAARRSELLELLSAGNVRVQSDGGPAERLWRWLKTVAGSPPDHFDLDSVPVGQRISREATFELVRLLAAGHDPPAFVAGEPIQVNDMFRYVDQDSAVLGWASSALLVTMLLVLFRSLRWVVLPLLVVHMTLVWTKAVLVLSGLRLSMVSSTLTSLVTIIGIATVTHVTVNYREWRLKFDREEAFRRTLAQLGPAVFWTCTTTAIGFGSLLTSQIVPVRSFGLMLALASLLVLVVCLVLLPGGVLLWRIDSDPRPTVAESKLIRFLQHLSRGVERHPRAWLLGLTAMMAVTGVGFRWLTVETDFSRNFREKSDIVQALRFFEREMGGAGTWEIHFDAPESITDASLAEVTQLATALRELRLSDGTRLTKVIEISDGISLVPNWGPHGRLDSAGKLEALAEIQPEFVRSLYNPESGKMRIVLRTMEQQPAEVKLELIRQVTDIARTQHPEARATGFYVLLSNLINSLMGDQLESFLWASLGIFLCMWLAFRSFWIGLVSLLPNVFPLVLVIGGMGWVGLPINIGTAMIACVSMGLTVDSSIHYITSYKRAREQGATYAAAIRSAHGTVGVAMVFANFVLALGFLVLALSNFIPLVYFGVLVSLSMIGGLLGDLVMLPLLLRFVPLRGAGSMDAQLRNDAASTGL